MGRRMLCSLAAIAVGLMASAGAPRANTVIGATGSGGTSCDPVPNSVCEGGSGGGGESVTATGQTAIAYGGDGGWPGLGYLNSQYSWQEAGLGGDGGSATAIATASGAGAIASALAVGGNGAPSGLQSGFVGDANAVSTATAMSAYFGTVNVGVTASATEGYTEGPLTVDEPQTRAYAFAVAFPSWAEVEAILGSATAEELIGAGLTVLGIGSVSADNGYFVSPNVGFDFSGSYHGDIYLDTENIGPIPGPWSDGSYLGPFTGDGTYVIAAKAPEPSTWAMMLIGFVGITYAAYSRRRDLDVSFLSRALNEVTAR